MLRLSESADALIEGFRPGVMERLGLGPDHVRARNGRLVYARATGYGQEGPLASEPGHDINYISVAGALGALARRSTKPLFPLSLVGDFGGGGMMVAFGVLCGVLEARRSGTGQVVDAAMVDGTALLTTAFHALRNAGRWNDEPGTNAYDTGSHFYEVYETSDGGHVAVGAAEPRFYARLLDVLGLDPAEYPQADAERWPELTQRFADVFRTRTRDEWATILEPAGACATAVYGLRDAPEHPHNVARETFVEIGGQLQPAPAPRFSRTVPRTPTPAPEPGADTRTALTAWGLSEAEVAALTGPRKTRRNDDESC